MSWLMCWLHVNTVVSTSRSQRLSWVISRNPATMECIGWFEGGVCYLRVFSIQILTAHDGRGKIVGYGLKITQNHRGAIVFTIPRCLGSHIDFWHLIG